MSGTSRKLVTGFLAAVLVVGVSCTSSDAPLSPSTEPGFDQPSPLLGGLLQNLNLLSCTTQPYAATTKTVGSAGGTIQVGTHKLVIPAGALSSPVMITAEQVSGTVNSVRFAPEGLQFAKPATLTLSYANCKSLLGLKKLVYTDEGLHVLELLTSLDNLLSKNVTGSIRHFSRYAVAW
jgi:hypothetical protein